MKKNYNNYMAMCGVVNPLSPIERKVEGVEPLVGDINYNVDMEQRELSRSESPSRGGDIEAKYNWTF